MRYSPREDTQFFTHESVTVDNTAGGLALTAATYLSATYALVTVEDAQIRWICDPATTVSSSVGHIANVGDVIELRGSNNIARFRAIRTGGTSGVIKVSYGR